VTQDLRNQKRVPQLQTSVQELGLESSNPVEEGLHRLPLTRNNLWKPAQQVCLCLLRETYIEGSNGGPGLEGSTGVTIDPGDLITKDRYSRHSRQE
jgi:hypothetical protein